MYYVYVLKSVEHGLKYIGMTRNLKRRFLSHNRGDSLFTKKYKPFILLYYEAAVGEKDARAREKYLKSGMGRKYLMNRLKFFNGMESR